MVVSKLILELATSMANCKEEFQYGGRKKDCVSMRLTCIRLISLQYKLHQSTTYMNGCIYMQTKKELFSYIITISEHSTPNADLKG